MGGWIKFLGDNKHLEDSEELNTIATLAVAKVLKIINKSNSNATDKLDL